MARRTKRFRSAEEMGAWYDEHEVDEKGSTPVTVRAERRYDPTLTMRLPEAALDRLKAIADERGLPTATLARMLLLERLRDEQDPVAMAVHVLGAVADHEALRDALRDLLDKESPDAVDRARRRLKGAGGR